MQWQRQPAWHPYRQSTDWFWLSRRVGRIFRWAMRAPADRLTLPVAASLFGAADLLHATGIPAPLAGVVSIVAVPALAYAVIKHRSHGHGKDQDQAAWRAGKSAIGAGLLGIWTTGADEWGVAAGPWHAWTLVYLTGAGLAYLVIRFDEVTRHRRDWRSEKMRWHAVSKLYGLQGSHLIESKPTRLGRQMEVDVTGTGKRASSIAGSRDTAERIAEHRMLPASRVHVRAGKIAGRIRISIRERDPWAHPVLHPSLDPAAEIELPASQSITVPATVGMDPDTGRPLNLSVYDAEDFGARAITIISTRGGGKTVLLNDIREALSRCDDVLIWDINLSKAKENRRWAPACDLVAHGPNATRDALTILRLARKVIEWRGNVDSDDAIHQPTAAAPAIVVIIDEGKALLGGQSGLASAIREAMTYLNDTGRSEGVVTIHASQRNTLSHGATTDVRANQDTFAVARVRSRMEQTYAAGEVGMDLPDMTSYGEGQAGVWLIGTTGGEWATGRTFMLKDLADITRLAEARPPRAQLEPGLREYLGDAYERLKAGGPIAHVVDDGPRPDWMNELDKEIAGMAPDVLDEMERIAATNRQTRQGLDQLADEPLTQLGPEHAAALARLLAERTRQAMLTVDIPADRRQAILDMAANGVAMRELVARLGVSKTTVYGYLARLRWEGLVEHQGRGAGARWHLAAQPPQEASG